jgi:hypothetical protein
MYGSLALNLYLVFRAGYRAFSGMCWRYGSIRVRVGHGFIEAEVLRLTGRLSLSFLVG